MADGGSLKVLVAGAGAIGQFVGSRLHEARHDVTLLTTQRHIDAFGRDGLCVRGDENYCWDPHAVTTAAAAGAGGPFDAILLTCKAHTTAWLAKEVAPLLAADGVFASLQNGLGNAAKVAASAPVQAVAVALTSHGVTIDAPGTVLHAGAGPTLVGPHGPQAVRAARVAEKLLADARLEPTWHDDMEPFVWRKAVINAGINPVGALSGARNGSILADDALQRQCVALIREAEALAARAGVRLPRGDLAEAARGTLSRTSGNRCSMLQDVEARRATEVEQITGRMVRLAARLGVPMPASEEVYRRIKKLEADYLGASAAEALAHDEIEWERSAH